MEKVHYAELTPGEFRTRLKDAPIAYLPLGTLEWHGEHLPLGADGLQSSGFFEILARKVGGIVLPMLFLGPDRVREEGDRALYGMDFCTNSPDKRYPEGRLDGSAYWVPDTLFAAILDGAMRQLARAGFKIVVAHGHGPSTRMFSENIQAYRERYGLACFTCWGGKGDSEGLGIQVDHAAMNETSLVMALRPELAKMENLPQDLNVWPVAINGKDPRTHASAELGKTILAAEADRMAGLLAEALGRL